VRLLVEVVLDDLRLVYSNLFGSFHGQNTLRLQFVVLCFDKNLNPFLEQFLCLQNRKYFLLVHLSKTVDERNLGELHFPSSSGRGVDILNKVDDFHIGGRGAFVTI